MHSTTNSPIGQIQRSPFDIKFPDASNPILFLMIYDCAERSACFYSVLASSGIDYDVKLWMPVSNAPGIDPAKLSEVKDVGGKVVWDTNSKASHKG